MKKPDNKFLILLIIIAACVAIAFYVGFIRDIESVYTQLFYFPVILAGMWYYRKAVYVALFLGTVHVFVAHLSVQDVTLVNFERAVILVVVAYIIGLISAKRAEGVAKLHETRDYLENLINYANAPIIVWGPDFRITRFNHAFERLTGYKSDDVVGKELSILFPDASLAESMNRIGTTSDGVFWESVEIPILRKDGDARLALWNSANIYAKDDKTILATIAQGIDITERKLSEKAIAASKAYAESIIRNFLDTLIVVDAEAKIKTVNPATCHLLGYTETELIGKPVSIIFAEEEEEEVKRVFQFFCVAEKAGSLRSQDTIRNRELNYKTKDGRLIPMSFNASMLSDEAGNRAGVVAGAKDITEIKQAEEARRKTEEYYRKVIENIFKFVPEGLLVFTDKINLFKQNKAFQDIVKEYASKLNYTEQELAELIVEQVKNRIIKKDYADIRIPKTKDRKTKNKQNNL